MAGHSKWDNIKRKKMKEDARRGKTFTKIARLITVAARAGGGNPEANFRLRLAVEKARAVNMPQENVERAIKRGTGELGGAAYEEMVYEGYGPGGVAFFIEIATDNRNRTAADLRYLFSKHGGNLGESGCVAWMFETKGVLAVDRRVGIGEEALLSEAIAAGAEDVVGDSEGWRIDTDPVLFEEVKRRLEKAGIAFSRAEITRIPKTTMEIDADAAQRVIKLIDALEEHDDVQEVFTNLELSDQALAALS